MEQDLKDAMKDILTDGTFSLIGKALYFSEGKRNQEWRLCLPRDMEKDILQLSHDKVGHPGIRRTLLTLRPRYYFPRMSRKIRRYINSCQTCQTSKPVHKPATGPLYPITTNDPLHTIAIEFVTGLPPAKNGIDAVLTITDKMTKAVRILPCKTTTTAKDTARLYMREVYPVFGLPSKIISDRDTRFTSQFCQCLTALLGIDLGLTAAYHPSADGQSEKTNQTMEIMLRCMISPAYLESCHYSYQVRDHRQGDNGGI
jgi:hypothetical protein